MSEHIGTVYVPGLHPGQLHVWVTVDEFGELTHLQVSESSNLIDASSPITKAETAQMYSSELWQVVENRVAELTEMDNGD